MKTLRWLAFSLSLLYTLTAFFALTAGESLPYEFRSSAFAFQYHDNMPWMLPVAILATMIVTISSKSSPGTNTLVLVVTVVLGVYGAVNAALDNFPKVPWVTTQVWENRQEPGIKVVQQYSNMGAMGGRAERIAKLTPVFLIFNKVERLNALPANNSEWKMVPQHVQQPQ